MDTTEAIRKAETVIINSLVESDDKANERARLERLHGRVWDTSELTKSFEVSSFMAPYVVVTEKSSGRKGTMLFQDRPRFYFGFKA